LIRSFSNHREQTELTDIIPPVNYLPRFSLEVSSARRVLCVIQDSGTLLGLLGTVLLFAAGCSMITPPTTIHQPMTARPAPSADVTTNPGAIYQPDSARLVLYEDRRARFVGDSITIVIEEKTSASKKSNATTNRTGSIDLTVPIVSGVPFRTFQGMDVNASSATKFAGGGDASSNNLFQGNLAVTVIEVYPNGNLLVSGEKQITINQGTEFIRFSGVVNPVHITSLNTVSSTRVADARIEYRGNSYINEAQTMGWLSRVFNLIWPF
jgi:flagellar L-ring protein precursor FlgH